MRKTETREERKQKAIGYVRVSTEDQASKGISLDAQKAKIQGYADLYDFELVDIKTDAGISGKTLNRPAIQEVLSLCRAGDVDAVIVFKLDRLSRRTADILSLADTVFSKGKVSLHSISEKLDTRTAAGRFTLTILAALAQMEREQIGERTSAALQHKIARNEYIGGNRPFGYTVQEDGSLEADSDEQAAVELIAELKRRGYSFRKIAAELNSRGIPSATGRKWVHTSIRKIYLRAA